MADPSAQREADRLQYSLRSSFFYRRRNDLKRLFKEIDQIKPSKYEWENPGDLGISDFSWISVRRKGISPHRIFCHPDLIRHHPHLIAYYRSIAVLPQKAVQRVAFGVKALEEGRSRQLSKNRAEELSKALNVFICGLIDADSTFSVEGARIAAIMNFGSQINGSWRNEIGVEGTRRVKELLLKYLLDQKLASQVISKAGSSLPAGSPSYSIDDVREIVVKNKYKIVFGSEPDISIINPQSTLEAAFEVKAGIDPAGALERYGAAKKSFDNALRQNKAATTVYVASTITEGVRRAMADDRLVKKDFNLTNIFTSKDAKEEFLEYVRWLLHL